MMRQADGQLNRLGPGHRELDSLGARNVLNELLADFDVLLREEDS